MINYIGKLENFCRIKYTYKTWKHVQRVRDLARSNPLASFLRKDILDIVCLCHDLIEDTDVTIEDLREYIPSDIFHICTTSIQLVTKKKGEPYVNYIKLIRDSNDPYAYVCKLSDMKDHLLQKETLTNRKKKKYDTAMPELL